MNDLYRWRISGVNSTSNRQASGAIPFHGPCRYHMDTLMQIIVFSKCIWSCLHVENTAMSFAHTCIWSCLLVNARLAAILRYVVICGLKNSLSETFCRQTVHGVIQLLMNHYTPSSNLIQDNVFYKQTVFFIMSF